MPFIPALGEPFSPLKYIKKSNNLKSKSFITILVKLISFCYGFILKFLNLTQEIKWMIF